MPKLQLIFFSLTRLRTGAVTLERLQADIEDLGDLEVDTVTAPEPVKSIRLDLVTFRYETASAPSLDRATIDVPVRTSVGIVGTTGSGKTTAIDILAGLLMPQAGALMVDGKPLDHPATIAWRRRVGYVPQTIYLTDASVLENIAFGVPAADVDRAAVERAARIANIHDFVVKELPNGYDTVVGDRGVRLSGGQRQRIGIARALYHDPAVLIFDEATSAVDNVTERAIIDAIDTIASQRTIVIIAHRLETVRNCDNIFILDQGKVQASGTFDELFSQQPSFRRLVSGELAVSGE
jgi:ABC-type multidrug transport system fused ATPase/permease subunit